MDYEVDFGILTSSGKRAAHVAQEAKPGLAQMRIDSVGEALPGSASGAVANRLDDAWVKSAEEISGNLDSYARTLTETAQRYRQAEKAAAQAVAKFFRGIR